MVYMWPCYYYFAWWRNDIMEMFLVLLALCEGIHRERQPGTTGNFRTIRSLQWTVSGLCKTVGNSYLSGQVRISLNTSHIQSRIPCRFRHPQSQFKPIHHPRCHWMPCRLPLTATRLGLWNSLNFFIKTRLIIAILLSTLKCNQRDMGEKYLPFPLYFYEY